MYAISRLDLDKLDAQEKDKYRALIPDSTLHRFLDAHPEHLAFGAVVDGQPVGILLATLVPVLHLSEIQGLFVDPSQRNRGIATQLMQSLQLELIQEKFKLILFSYSSENSYVSILEHLLSKLHWGEVKINRIHCRFDGYTFSPPWLQLQYSLPLDFHIFPWEELQPTEREKLIHREEHRFFPLEISPFKDETRIEMLNSLGLRHKGEVVGWIITHRIAEDLICYSALYVERRWQQSGIAIRLLCDAINLQKESRIQWAELEVNVGLTESGWLRFVERRLIPYTTSVSYIKQSWKSLQD